jgi:hypothetical protein
MDVRSRLRRFGRIGVAPLLALATVAATTATARAENMSAKFIRIDPEPGSVEKTGTPVINMLIEVGQPVPITSFQESCFPGGKGDKVQSAGLSCMSAKIEKEGYEKQFEFPKENAIITALVKDDQFPMNVASADPFKDAQATNAGIAWVILMDASSSVDVSRWSEEQEVAEQIVKAMGQNDAVQVKIMDDKAVQRKSKWLAASNKQKAIDTIRSVPASFPAAANVDSLIGRLQTESVSSFQELFKDGIDGGEEDVTPLMQALVFLSDGGDTSTVGFSGGATAQVAHEKLVAGHFDQVSTLVQLPMPVISIWFPDPKLTGGIENVTEQKANNAYSWMSNIATPEVGGYFDIVQKGEGGKGQKIAKTIRSRFDNMYYVQAEAACLSPSGTQTFTVAFQDTKSKISPDQWKDVGIDPNYFGKWLLDVDKKKTEASATQNPLQPGTTFDVFGDFCWTENNEAEAYFVTAADQGDVKKATDDKTGKAGKALLQNLKSKGQQAETVSVSQTGAKFKVPNTPALFDNQPDAFNLNLVVYDTKQKRVSALNQKGVILMRGAKPPVNKLLIVGAIGGGVVLILLIAILARSGGGGNGRSKRRRGGGPPAPGPMPGQPPGPPPVAFAGAPGTMGATDAPVVNVPVVMRPASPGMPPLPPMAAPAQMQTAVVPQQQTPQQGSAQATAYAPAPASGFAPGGMAATYLPGGAQASPTTNPLPAPLPAPAPATALAPAPVAPMAMAPIAMATAPAPPQPMQPMAYPGTQPQPLSPAQKGATSFPTTCPNPACRKSVMVPPGGTAQCAFCGTLVDASGGVAGEIAKGGYGLTGHVDANAAQRAVQAAAAEAPRAPAGGTVALQGTAPMVSSIALVGPSGTFKVLPGIESRVGRDGTQCTIALAEPRISGVHATLKIDPGAGTLLVRDDRSHNGTFVNGNRIPPGAWTPVPAGSQLKFGPIEFAVRVEG